MAQSLDLYIDTTNGLLVSAGSARNGSLPTLTRNDSYNFRVRLQERDTNGFLRDFDTTGSSLKLGIGGIDDGPSDGSFRLVLNSITSSAIQYNATAISVYNAISGIAGTGVSVTTYGNEPFSYLITSAAANTAMSFGGDSFTLFPTSSVIVNTRRFPKASVEAQQVIKLRRNPAVYSDTFASSSTSGIVSLTPLQDGSPTQNETYALAVGSDAIGGSLIFSYGGNTTTAIPLGSNSVSFVEALSAVTGIGAGNIGVDIGNNAGNYTISFVRNLGLTNVSTALTLDTSSVIFAQFLQSTVTMSTAELDELFAEAGTDEITPSIEVELVQSGTPKTVYQGSVSVRRDLITTGSVVPAAQANYLTAAESYAAFVRNSTTGVDSTAGILKDNSAVASVNYGSRTLNNSSGTSVVSYGAGLAFSNTPMGFFGASVTARPSGTNIVSGLTNLGLLSYTQPTALNVLSALEQTGLIVNSNTSTYGVLPQSPRTLTAVTYTTFGPVPSNNVISKTVTITGCQLNDIVLLGLPADIEEGLSFSGHVVTANQIHIDALNVTGSGKTQNATTFRVTVIGY